MARTNQKNIKPFKAGQSKRQTAELKFLQAVQDWYADKVIGKPKTIGSWKLITRVRDSVQCPDYEQLLFWYTYGFNRGVVTVTFDWFKQFAKGSDVQSRFREPARQKKYCWGPCPDKGVGSYSGKRHEPKSEEWREQKKLRSEWRKKKKRRNWHSEGWDYGPRPCDKKERARLHRKFCKQMIHRENWDAFHQTAQSSLEYTCWVDPWSTWA